MGVKITSFIKVDVGSTEKIVNQLKNIPEIVKIVSITGEYDLLIEIMVEQSEDLVNLFSKQIDLISGIKEIHSHYIMKTWEK